MNASGNLVALGTIVRREIVRILRIARTLFLKMLEGYPDAANRLRVYMASRATRTADDIRKVGSALDARSGES